MTITIEPADLIGTLAAERPALLPVFDRFGLDYCCHGRRSFAEACAAAGVRIEDVLAAVAQDHSPAGPAQEVDWRGATMTELADHIEQTHHVEARLLIQQFRALAPRVAAAHGDRHPELRQLQAELDELADEMHEHMIREERVLFPWLRRLDRHSEIHTGPPWSVRRPIDCMVHDHDRVAAAFDRIGKLTHHYAVPDDACGSYRRLMETLLAFEADTRRHIHKENNILFPAGVAAEARMPGGAKAHNP